MPRESRVNQELIRTDDHYIVCLGVRVLSVVVMAAERRRDYGKIARIYF
jgi:hypothetical protein